VRVTKGITMSIMAKVIGIDTPMNTLIGITLNSIGMILISKVFGTDAPMNTLIDITLNSIGMISIRIILNGMNTVLIYVI
jgi:hypothetical protein